MHCPFSHLQGEYPTTRGVYNRFYDWRHGARHEAQGTEAHPQAQGLVERNIRTLKEEWLTWREPNSVLELQRSLDEFRDWYNRVRFHMSLDYRTPEVVHNAS
ncbi:MAG: transposase [Euryarchaeota archaeon]|nr:transposase [Euryarchaeota archaeon]